MHASLAELLENLGPGLLWVTRDGLVRYANALGAAQTGLTAGRKLWDPDLSRAVVAVVGTGAARSLETLGVSSGGATAPTLRCRVIPGLSRDDAFVLLQGDGSSQGAALDDLMQVIRSDLRAPLKLAQGGLEQASHGSSAASLDPLLQGVHGLLHALDTLLDLATVWRSGALMANDRIELWPLLQQVWARVEPLAQDRGVKVRFRAQTDTASLATLYGSEAWLGRVMQECLEAALRTSPTGATLTIEHRQLGPRALIVFRDCGVFASPDAAAVTLGGAHARSARRDGPRLAPRDQVGLELCRHVVSLHGGQLREEREEGLRNFLIELPTGAPHRAEQAPIDPAQVQQYARDLAELMSRARQRAQTNPVTSGTASA